MDENKKELFDFLATEVVKHDFGEEKEVVITIGSDALTLNSQVQLPCSHEEADSRMAIHIMNALEEGNNTFLVRSVDSDVVIILLGKLDEIMTRYPDTDIWIRFGKGNTLTNISLTSVFNNIGKEIARGLPFFHAFTGCDTTSAFKGKAKKTAW